MSFAFFGWLIFGIAVLLWAVILVVFAIIKIRNIVQRKKYSVKQDGDVSTKYESRGLH
jgi:heme exporter protein D